jgi:hypothetical protein
MDHTGHARLPKSDVKKMAESTSLVGWPMDFRKAVSTHITMIIGLRYCRSTGANLSRVDEMAKIK